MIQPPFQENTATEDTKTNPKENRIGMFFSDAS